uniref:Phospholipase B1, membrane-associated-like n=1 Tax=Knipowitschia caucasica TaxID=637954 RepID=A0AAV2KGN1_KNICA
MPFKLEHSSARARCSGVIRARRPHVSALQRLQRHARQRWTEQRLPFRVVALVPRALVNVVQVLQIDTLKSVQRNTIGCSLLQRTECPCVVNPSINSLEFEEIRRINREYQAELEFLLSSDRFDRKEDFAVVLQPFLHNYFLPHVGEGEVDTSFYSLDCFHLSDRAQAEMAIALWNNMLEPVGRKTALNDYTHNRSKIHCPTQDAPFIFTKMNSLSVSSTAPPSTPGPESSTSPWTSSVTGPQPLCPPSLPVWVPVLASVGSLALVWPGPSAPA